MHHEKTRPASATGRASGNVFAAGVDTPEATHPRKPVQGRIIAFPRRGAVNGVWIGAFRAREFVRISSRLRASIARKAAELRRQYKPEITSRVLPAGLRGDRNVV
jgi:hypothetical protein